MSNLAAFRPAHGNRAKGFCNVTQVLDKQRHSRVAFMDSFSNQRLSTRPRAGIMAERSEAPASFAEGKPTV
jgi:hypothetical protein